MASDKEREFEKVEGAARRADLIFERLDKANDDLERVISQLRDVLRDSDNNKNKDEE